MLRIELPHLKENQIRFRCEQCAGEPVNVEHLEEAARRASAREITKPTFVRVADVKANLPFDARMAQTGERVED